MIINKEEAENPLKSRHYKKFKNYETSNECESFDY